MNDIADSIKEIVIELDSSLETATDLDAVVLAVMDRAMIFMRRDQFVLQYEEDLGDYEIEDRTDRDETYYEYWKHYGKYPIPDRLVRPLAEVVVNTYKTKEAVDDGQKREVRTIKDNGQEITYTDNTVSFFNSVSESQVFSGCLELLKRYRVGTV